MVIKLTNEFETLIDENLKNAINYSVKIAENNNTEIYLIGGIVRDLILKTQIKDIDITVKADAVEFCRSLENEGKCRIISVQEKLRTAKVEFKSGVLIDFASTREEYYTKGGVLPSAVNFGCDLALDVKRRDFTINTLALKLSGDNKYSLIDYFNGFDDIKNKKIRILHDKSFIDDPSRIVRAIKFQMRLNFSIEKKTEQLMKKYLENVDKTIPLERIKNELRMYFNIKKTGIYSNLTEKKVYKLICDNPLKSVSETAINEIKNYFDFNNLWFIYIACLLINSDVENSSLNLTSIEKKTIREVKELLNLFPLNIEDNFAIYNAFIEKTELSPVIYYTITQDKAVLKFYNVLKQIKVLVTGSDLIKLGFIPSPYFSELMKKILKEKLEGKLQSKAEELDFVKQFLKNI